MLTNPWLKNLKNRLELAPARPSRRRNAYRPMVESLEDRCLLSTFTVLNTNDIGAGSLRQAILDANTTANVGVADVIAFNIPGAGVHTISVGSTLPAILDPVIIDGYRQPGASPNTLAVGGDAVLLIELEGSNAIGSRGLQLASSGNTIRGLVINRFPQGGIEIGANIGGPASNNVVEGNFIGTDPTGTLDRGNLSNGVTTASFGVNNLIGGTTAAARNVISGNSLTGIAISNSSGVVVRGNYIGTDKTGTIDLGNAHGIRVSIGGHNAVIGGSDAADGTLDGIVGARNVISGNDAFGVIADTSANADLGAVTIQGNFIGLNAAGSAALGNSGAGIGNDGRRRTGITTIGGLAAGAGNVISGNGLSGISNGAAGTIVQGNFIGTDVSGTIDLGNTTEGILNHGGSTVTIGGGASGARNVISGNGGHGILTAGSVQGNFIGTQSDGVSPLGNNGHGVLFAGIGATIGGLAAGEGNTIAHNGLTGVILGVSTQTAILGNSIFSNSRLGIDLGNFNIETNGVTVNDAGDGDTAGANKLQNFPVLAAVSTTATATTIQGTLNSTPNTTFRLEFFSNAVIDPTGFGEGQTFLGFTNVTTPLGGNDVSFTVTLPVAVPVGHFVTATATDSAGNTSEFSQNRVVVSGNRAPVASPNAYSVNEDATLNVAAPGVLANDSDPDGNPLTAVLVSGPTNGALTLSTNGSFTYTPASNFNSVDSFT